MSTDSPLKRPHNATRQRSRPLPTLPATKTLETVSSLKAVIPASAALARFSQALNQSSVKQVVSPAFSLLDCAGALQLEGDVVDLHSALYTAGQSSAILSRHARARSDAHKRLSAEPVGSTLALELASALAGTPVSVRRSALEHADPSLLNRHYALLSAPHGAERLQALLEDWQAFVQRQAGDLDPLLMSAAAHGQWIALRPFTQANIATGQMLSALLLCEEGLQPDPVLPLALYFSRHAERYWEALFRAMAYGDYAGWIRFFMAAVVETSTEATEQIMQWEKHWQELTDTLHQVLPKAPSAELILMCARPGFGLADLAQVGLTRRQTAAAWMHKLVAADVLGETRAGKEKRYVNKAVLSLLLE